MVKTLAVVLAFGVGPRAMAWGERGHHEVCAAATRLVQNNALKRKLRGKLHMMGHLCNVPDIHWRQLREGRAGDQSHFMNFENLDLTPDTTPLDWGELLRLKSSVPDVGHSLGSSWFRYKQFHDLAVASGKKRDPSRMLVHMGVMGHFVGDAAQPLHNTSDYDGWATGHGGLHSYYETQLVNELPLDLMDKVYRRAVEIRQERVIPGAPPGFVMGEGSLERIRNVTRAALAQKARILELDVVRTPSSREKDSRGVWKQTEAKRRTPQEAWKDFEPLIVNQMAWAAAALAESWDQIYLEAGEPRFKTDFNYPFKPEFVAPSYGDRKPSSVRGPKVVPKKTKAAPRPSKTR